ncbi:MAG: stage II sporulation protein P [Clostridia bacterium]|nr:stage II sporulation protein P [Clostridia bacterium]
MKNRSGEIRLAAICLLCVAMFLYSGYRYCFGEDAENPLPTAVTTPEKPQTVSKSDTTKAPQKTAEAVAQKSESTNNTESVAAAAKGKVKGKVIGKFYSPYTANTSYNGIYLKNSSGLKVDLKSLVTADLPYKIKKNDQPQVLIIHTHTTESFLPETRDYYTDKDEVRTLNEKANVVALGNIMTDKLNAAGIKTVHDTTVHDYPAYNGSYDRAAETIKKNLKKYPSIKIVIDLHRDAIAGDGNNRIKPIAKIGGKNAAQVMLVMGSQSGGITAFPKWQENLKLAVRFQQKMESMYPGLARSISLMSRLYNENLTTGSLLLEVGTEVNSIEEVSYSAELAANALVSVLNGAQ